MAKTKTLKYETILTFRKILHLVLGTTILSIVLFAGSYPILQVFTIILGGLYLFTTETLPIDMTALLIMILVIISGIITPSEGLSGFSSSATITVLCMFILSAGVERTGMINHLGHICMRFAGNSHIRQLLIISLIIGPISGFLNNTAAVAIFLPLVIHMAKESKIPVTKLLIPLSFISMLGGTLTLLGSSTNILANASMEQQGLKPLGIFDFSKVGIIILIVGVIYFITIGRFLLPSRKHEDEDDSGIPNTFLASIKVKEGSILIGKTIQETNFQEKNEVKAVKLIRGEKSYIKAITRKEILEGDVIVINGTQNKIAAFDDENKKETLIVDFDNPQRRIPTGKIMKILIKSSHYFHNKSASEINFWDRYGIAPTGIHRDKINTMRLRDLTLTHGEILLVKVAQRNISKIKKSSEFLILEEIEDEFDPEKTRYAIGIAVLVIGLAALNIVPIVVSALIGVFLMFATRCLRTQEVYESVNWDIIFLLAGVIPLGIAMQKSGGADLIANTLITFSDNASPIILLGTFYLITTLLTEIISNNAAVVLLIPIAASVATKLGLNPTAFTLVVMFAASTSFLSPVGYQTNTIVYASGNYRFSDFIKVGAPLNIILLFVTTFLIYHFFGL